MNKGKTHWRTVAGKNNLVGELLQGKEVTLTIKECIREDVINVQKSKKERKPVYDKKGVLYFAGTEKKLVLNTTNFKAITKVLKSPYVEDWAGKQITLIPQKGTFFGETQEVIRIKQDYSNVKM